MEFVLFVYFYVFPWQQRLFANDENYEKVNKKIAK
jgi:hypothetical protein